MVGLAARCRAYRAIRSAVVSLDIVVVGVPLLVVLGIWIGTSLDTQAQRRAAREVARARRENSVELRALMEERHRLRRERKRLAKREDGDPEKYGPSPETRGQPRRKRV